jgi:hypothetical protein
MVQAPSPVFAGKEGEPVQVEAIILASKCRVRLKVLDMHCAQG